MTSQQMQVSEVFTDAGRTSIADVVVAKIAGIAAREVEGVHKLVTQGFTRSMSEWAQRISGADNRGHAVAVEVGQRETAIDLAIVIEYGAVIGVVTSGIRERITDQVESLTGLTVKEINIFVADLYFPEDDEPSPPQRRVE